MTNRLTFAIIKPNVVNNNKIGEVLQIIEDKGFVIKNMLLTTLSKEQAGEFYSVHKEKEFYTRLIHFMISGKIVALQLEKENAVEDFRELLGSTNPENAAEGTIRKLYGETVTINAVHGSDSNENAFIEASFFFKNLE